VPVVRSASLHGFATLVRELGGDPVHIARKAGLPRAALEEHEILVPVAAEAESMEIAARELNCPDFGLRLADFQDLGGLGPLAIAIRNSTDLGEALEVAQRFLTLHNQGSTLTIEPDPYEIRGVLGLRHVWSLQGSSYTQATEKALLNVHRVVQVLAGTDYGLRSVEVAHVPATSVERFSDAFGGVRVNVSRPESMLRMPGALLTQSISQAESVVRDVAMQYLAAQPTRGEPVTTTLTRTTVEALIGTGKLSTSAVAAALELAPRTLQRRLADEHTTLAVITDEVRRAKAVQWLAATDLSIAEISAMLDIADQATLSRSARRWWGVSPTQKRRELRAMTEPLLKS